MSGQISEKAGWEVEGFIDRLTRRNSTNEERLVLEAISHLRAFSRDCDALRESNRKAADEIERLQTALPLHENPPKLVPEKITPENECGSKPQVSR